jgi:hypothetical protein
MVRYGLGYCVLIGILGGCAGGGSATSSPSAPNDGSRSRFASLIPPEFRPLGPVPFHGIPTPRKHRTLGIYVGTFEQASVFGYPPNNRSNGPPTCSVTSFQYVNGFTVDGLGHLVVPSGGDRKIYFFRRPMCGAEKGSVADPFGQTIRRGHCERQCPG